VTAVTNAKARVQDSRDSLHHSYCHNLQPILEHSHSPKSSARPIKTKTVNRSSPHRNNCIAGRVELSFTSSLSSEASVASVAWVWAQVWYAQVGWLVVLVLVRVSVQAVLVVEMGGSVMALVDLELLVEFPCRAAQVSTVVPTGVRSALV
jgi:hypothetical protein